MIASIQMLHNILVHKRIVIGIGHIKLISKKHVGSVLKWCFNHMLIPTTESAMQNKEVEKIEINTASW